MILYIHSILHFSHFNFQQRESSGEGERHRQSDVNINLYVRKKHEENDDKGPGCEDSYNGLQPTREVRNGGVYTDSHVGVDPEWATPI